VAEAVEETAQVLEVLIMQEEEEERGSIKQALLILSHLVLLTQSR
jgi:hypothetical protein